MTTKIKNVQVAPNTEPSNSADKTVSHFKNLLNLAKKNDKELTALNLTTDSVCNDIVKHYEGLDIKAFNEKYRTDAIQNDIAIRVKGHKNSDTAKPITGTAKTVISNTKKHIDKIGKIDGLSYGEVRKAVNDLSKPVISEKRKNANKDIAKLNDIEFFEMVNLWLDSKK